VYLESKIKDEDDEDLETGVNEYANVLKMLFLGIRLVVAEPI